MSSTPEIEAQFINAKGDGLFEALLKQIDKDFLRAGLSENFMAENDPIKAARNLVAAVYALIVSDFERYLSLLYIIDVDETEIKKMPVQNVDELAQAVCLLIVKRELNKVILKNKS